MPATPVSAVWEHFEVFEDKSFTCKIDDCGQHFRPPLRSTTAMRHLSRKHPDVHIIVFFMEQARKGGMKEEEVAADENEPDIKKVLADTILDEETMPTTSHSLKATKKDASPEKAMPNTKMHVLQASSEANVQEAMPSVTEQAVEYTAKAKRKAAIEAVKRIAHLNEWLLRVRKEQKQVRAKRTATRKSTKQKTEDEGDADWPVDYILDERWIDDKRQLLLRWAGFDASDDSWEPVEHLAGAPELLAAFDAGMDDGFDEEIMDDV